MKRKAPDLGWLVTLSVLGTTVVIGLVGSGLGAEPRTALWFVVGAVLAVGLALLRGQAAGLGEIIDLLREIREGLEDRETVDLLRQIGDSLHRIYLRG